jgi:hypothetical protein
MGVTTIEFKDYKIIRYSFWKFWRIDRLEFSLPSRYTDAYVEIEKKLVEGGRSYSMELRKSFIEDVRYQLSMLVEIYQKKVSKAKKLSVNFQTRENHQYYIDGLDFYIIDGEIYFECDESIKREKLLSKLGI